MVFFVVGVIFGSALSSAAHPKPKPFLDGFWKLDSDAFFVSRHLSRNLHSFPFYSSSHLSLPLIPPVPCVSIFLSASIRRKKFILDMRMNSGGEAFMPHVKQYV